MEVQFQPLDKERVNLLGLEKLYPLSKPEKSSELGCDFSYPLCGMTLVFLLIFKSKVKVNWKGNVHMTQWEWNTWIICQKLLIIKVEEKPQKAESVISTLVQNW